MRSVEIKIIKGYIDMANKGWPSRSMLSQFHTDYEADGRWLFNVYVREYASFSFIGFPHLKERFRKEIKKNYPEIIDCTFILKQINKIICKIN